MVPICSAQDEASAGSGANASVRIVNVAAKRIGIRLSMRLQHPGFTRRAKAPMLSLTGRCEGSLYTTALAPICCTAT